MKQRPMQTDTSPALEEARAALSVARADLGKTKAIGSKIRVAVDWIERQRDQNHFAEAIERLIVEGRDKG